MTYKKIPYLIALSPILILIVLLTTNVMMYDNTMGGSNQLALLFSGALASIIGISYGNQWESILQGIENSINASNWFELDYKGKIIIVFGSEGKGIRPQVLKACDFKGTIEMQGKINSLNVSASVSVILFERLRQLKTIV